MNVLLVGKPPELKIEFGAEREMDRIGQTLLRLPWYKEQGYDVSRIRLPEGLSEQSTAEEIREVVEDQFSTDRYEEYSRYVKKEWPGVSEDLLMLKQLKGFQLRDKYTLVLTKYGIGGSYDSSRARIVSNIELKTEDRIIRTIVHEIIHIGIQHLIDEHEIKHWHKERLVDLIGRRLFHILKDTQSIKEDTQAVDDAFEAHYPDIEAVIKAI